MRSTKRKETQNLSYVSMLDCCSIEFCCSVFCLLLKLHLCKHTGYFAYFRPCFGDSAIYQQILVTIMVAEIFVNYFLLARTSASFKATTFPRKDLTFDGTLKGVSIEHIHFILLYCKLVESEESFKHSSLWTLMKIYYSIL